MDYILIILIFVYTNFQHSDEYPVMSRISRNFSYSKMSALKPIKLKLPHSNIVGMKFTAFILFGGFWFTILIISFIMYWILKILSISEFSCQKFHKPDRHTKVKKKNNFHYFLKKRNKSSYLTNNCVYLKNYDNFLDKFETNSFKEFSKNDEYSSNYLNTNMSNKNEEKLSGEEEKPKNSGGGCCCCCKKKRSETISGSGTIKAEEAIMYQTKPVQPYYYTPAPVAMAPPQQFYHQQRRISPISKQSAVTQNYVPVPHKVLSPKASQEHYPAVVPTQRPPAPPPPPPPPPPPLPPPPPPVQQITRRPSPPSPSTTSHPQTASQQQLRRHEQVTLDPLPPQPQVYRPPPSPPQPVPECQEIRQQHRITTEIQQNVYRAPHPPPTMEPIKESQQPIYRNAPQNPLPSPPPSPRPTAVPPPVQQYKKESYSRVTTEKSVKPPSSVPVQTYGGSTTALSDEEKSEPKKGCCASKNKVKGPGALHAQIHGYKVEGHLNVKGKVNQATISIPEDSYLITK